MQILHFKCIQTIKLHVLVYKKLFQIIIATYTEVFCKRFFFVWSTPHIFIEWKAVLIKPKWRQIEINLSFNISEFWHKKALE